MHSLSDAPAFRLRHLLDVERAENALLRDALDRCLHAFRVMEAARAEGREVVVTADVEAANATREALRDLAGMDVVDHNRLLMREREELYERCHWLRVQLDRNMRREGIARFLQGLVPVALASHAVVRAYSDEEHKARRPAEWAGAVEARVKELASELGAVIQTAPRDGIVTLDPSP